MPIEAPAIEVRVSAVPAIELLVIEASVIEVLATAEAASGVKSNAAAAVVMNAMTIVVGVVRGADVANVLQLLRARLLTLGEMNAANPARHATSGRLPAVVSDRLTTNSTTICTLPAWMTKTVMKAARRRTKKSPRGKKPSTCSSTPT
jgi:hypothetical protein